MTTLRDRSSGRVKVVKVILLCRSVAWILRKWAGETAEILTEPSADILAVALSVELTRMDGAILRQSAELTVIGGIFTREAATEGGIMVDEIGVGMGPVTVVELLTDVGVNVG